MGYSIVRRHTDGFQERVKSGIDGRTGFNAHNKEKIKMKLLFGFTPATETTDVNRRDRYNARFSLKNHSLTNDHE